MSRTIRLAIALITLLAIVTPATPALAAPKPTKTTISGYVYGSDGIFIPGATVGVYLANKNGVYNLAATLTTDASGLWTYTGKGGTYRFDFAAPSADPQSQTLTAVEGVTYALDVTLQSYGSLAGSVFDGATALPIAGATVELYLRNPDGSWPSGASTTVSTGADGTYASGQIPAGRYVVKASASGYTSSYYGGPAPDSATVVFVRRGQAVAGIGIGLTPVSTNGSISGRVVSGALQTPMSSAYVYLYRQNADGTWPATSPGWGSPTFTVYTDTLGTYTTGPIPLGNYRVRFFTMHTGSQWWQYVPTVDLATPVSLTYGGQALAGIDGWFNKP